MKPQFHQTVNILVQAYLNDELEHANCSACAVGNLIAHANGVKPILRRYKNIGDFWTWSDGTIPAWPDVFVTDFKQKIHKEKYCGEAKRQIDSTGYSLEELASIELAFERCSDRWNVDDQTDNYKDSKMLQGLMAVVDVLAEIHNIDLTTKEEAKLLFAKP